MSPSLSPSSSSFLAGLTIGAVSLYLIQEIHRSLRSNNNNNKTAKQGKKPAAPRRVGGAIKLRKEQFDRYTELHDAVWPGVLERMYKSNIRNFVIYHHEETGTMFSHFEWIGDYSCETKEEADALFKLDMEAIANDPITKEWWSQCEPCQEPFSQWKEGSTLPSQGGEGDWWAPLECMVHCGHWPSDYVFEWRDPHFVPRNPSGKTTSQPVLLT